MTSKSGKNYVARHYSNNDQKGCPRKPIGPQVLKNSCGNDQKIVGYMKIKKKIRYQTQILEMKNTDSITKKKMLIKEKCLQKGETFQRHKKIEVEILGSLEDLIKQNEEKIKFTNEGLEKHLQEGQQQRKSSESVNFRLGNSNNSQDFKSDGKVVGKRSTSSQTLFQKSEEQRAKRVKRHDEYQKLEMPLVVKFLKKVCEIYAVQRNPEKVARLSLTDKNVCLHYLGDQHNIPTNAFKIEHSEVMKVLNSANCLAFLEFGTRTSTLGRVYIRLTPNTKRADNFVAMCTGIQGYSYANTHILEVSSKDLAGESMRCGDYSHHNGKGGAEVVKGAGTERGDVLNQVMVAGTVYAWSIGSEAHAGQFCIVTRDSGISFPSAFGKVESDLNILIDIIAKYPNIRDVKISDCGVVLPSEVLTTLSFVEKQNLSFRDIILT